MYTILGAVFVLIPPVLALLARRYVKRMPEQADPGFGTKGTAAVVGLVMAGLYGIWSGALLPGHPVIGVLGFVSLAFSLVGSAIWLVRYDKNADTVRESGGLVRRFKTKFLAIYAYLAGKLVNRLQKSRVRAVIGVYENLAAEGEAQVTEARKTEEKMKDDPSRKRERRNVQEGRRLIQREVGALKATAEQLRTLLNQDAIPGLAIERPELPELVSHIPQKLGLGALPVVGVSTVSLPLLEAKNASEKPSLPGGNGPSEGEQPLV